QSYIAGEHPNSIALADLNNDGKLDVVVANLGSEVDRGQLSVYLGKGDGTFPNPMNLDVGFRPRAVAVGDFLGNSLSDLVVANSGSDTITVYLGDGLGGFSGPFEYPSSDPADPTPGPVALVVGQFNNAGIDDVLVVNFGNFPFGHGALTLY